MDRLLVVPFKVRECSNFTDKNRPTWEQMQDLAIEIQPVSFVKAAGFCQQNGSEHEGDREEVAVETTNR